jgi:hypothetical protein
MTQTARQAGHASVTDHRPNASAPGPGRGGFGPYSRLIDRGAVGGAIDGRSREGRFLRAYERALTDHVGGDPSIVQRALISRAARLALHLELMDERSLAGDHVFTVHDHNHYVAWSNALARLLGGLGLKSAAVRPPSLDEHLAALAAEEEAAP